MRARTLADVFARELWQRIETLHAVTYFAPESHAAAKTAGLRGFWMGYFGFRAAPLGPVRPGVVEATFANFAPSMVRRSVPDAWSYADPVDLVRVRADAAAVALRRLVSDIDDVAPAVTDRLRGAIDRADPIGRPLFAANRDLDDPDDPVAGLWQQCTTLREHRGDGHVAVLSAADVDGCEAHLLLSAEQGVSPSVFFEHRGWTDDDQTAAQQRLERRGLLQGTELTDAGRALRAHVESTTDDLAATPFSPLLDDGTAASLLDALTAPALAVAHSGALPFPNPMGLPALAGDD